MGEFYLIKIHVIVALCHATTYVMHVIFISVYFLAKWLEGKDKLHIRMCTCVANNYFLCKQTRMYTVAPTLFLWPCCIVNYQMTLDPGHLRSPTSLPPNSILRNFGTWNLFESYVSIALSMSISPYWPLLWGREVRNPENWGLSWL